MNEELSHIHTILKDVLQDRSFNMKSSVTAAVRQSEPCDPSIHPIEQI